MWTLWACLYATHKCRADMEGFDGLFRLLFLWLNFAPTCYSTGGNSLFFSELEGEHLMLEDYVRKLAWVLSKHKLLSTAVYSVDLSVQGSNALPLPQPRVQCQ